TTTRVVLRVASSASTPIGTYPVIVQGISGDIQKKRTINTVVQPVPSAGTPRRLWGSEAAPVNVGSGQQTGPIAVMGGDGGAIFAMGDAPSSTSGLPKPRAQRLSSSGLAAWSSDSVP